jgi:hypothetical protein
MNDNILSFLSFSENAITSVNLDNGERVSVADFDEKVNLIPSSNYAFSNNDGLLKFYNSTSGDLLWEKDYSTNRLVSNLVVSGDQIFAIGLNKIFVLDKSDGCLIHESVLDFIGEDTKLQLKEDIISLNTNEILIRNDQNIYSVSIN